MLGFDDDDDDDGGGGGRGGRGRRVTRWIFGTGKTTTSSVIQS